MTRIEQRPPMLLACPHCAALWHRESGYDCLSRSMMSPFLWSDGVVREDPESTPSFSDTIARCWRCEHFFWIREASCERIIKPEELVIREGRSTLQKEIRAAYGDRLAPAGFVRQEWRIGAALDDGIARNKREAVFLSSRWLHQNNDVLRNIFLDAMTACAERFRWHRSDPEEDSYETRRLEHQLFRNEQTYFSMLNQLQLIAPAWLPAPGYDPFPPKTSEQKQAQDEWMELFRQKDYELDGRHLDLLAKSTPETDRRRSQLISMLATIIERIEYPEQVKVHEGTLLKSGRSTQPDNLHERLREWQIPETVMRPEDFYSASSALLDLLTDDKLEVLLLRAELHRERGEFADAEQALDRLDSMSGTAPMLRFHRRLIRDRLTIPVVIPNFAGGSQPGPTITIS